MLIGIVGKANVGKSTFFKAATLAEVLIANYPFATIKPNTGVAYVKTKCIDTEFNTRELSNIDPSKIAQRKKVTKKISHYIVNKKDKIRRYEKNKWSI